MFKFLKRIVAYFIDMMVVLIIVQTISSIPLLNHNTEKYTKTYNEYLTKIEESSKFNIDLINSYKDNKLTTKEYQKIIKDNPKYEKLLKKYYKDDKLSKKNYNKLQKEYKETILKDYKKTYYKLDKYSIIYNISYVVVTILYFVFFNLITDGVTLGKKLTRLKIVNNNNKNKKIKWPTYLLRSIMLYQIIYYLAKVIFINILGINEYYTISNIIYDIHTYLLFIIIALITIRKDERGLHDIICETKVIETDKFGNEKIK